ncbi:hypothetical protein HYE68_003312 [Fusarium pseudograminearum]|nr:hypothetical protein HYE68_003312 [Fusarium pseudograminearum]
MSYPPVVIEISDDDDEDIERDGGPGSAAILATRDKQALLKALNSIESTGDIAASSHYNIFVNPGLTIDGGNLVRLPLEEDDARTIKGACRQAPFSHGDNSVRNTWELDASKFDLGNPEWPKFFDKVLRDTATGLCSDELLAKPYKLLLCEPGSSFKPHKDSDRERGMVGTLILCLPSQHEGGDVHLSLGSQVKRLSTAPTSKFDITSISWFSDVTHKVTKVTSGYRLVLTYKLFIRGDDSISASAALEKIERLKHLLIKWESRPCQPDRIIYPLDHLYTEASLCLENMKGRDRAVAHSLNKICSEAGFYFMLAHAIHVRMGDDDHGGYDEGSEEYGNLRSIHTPSGVQVASDLAIDHDEILGYDINKEDPSSEDEGEFTGFENTTPTFRYHKTVAVVVLKDRLRKYLIKDVGLPSTVQRASTDRLTEMVLRDLANNRDDAYTKQAAAGFIDNVLLRSREPQGPIVRLISKWALELNNIAMFRTCVQATYAPLTPTAQKSHRPVYAKAISDELINHLRTRYAGQENTIDWDYWFKDFNQAIDIATEFDTFCYIFVSSITCEPLRNSFKAWASPIYDKKLASQTLWTLSDEKYILRLIEKRNKWALQSFLPKFVPRFHRSLLWALLHSITSGRFKRFKNSKELCKCIMKHGKGQLSLCGNDIMEVVNTPPGFCRNNLTPGHAVDTHHSEADDPDHRTSFKKFIRMVQESYINGAEQEALGFLQQSCQRLVDERQVWSSVSASYLVNNFLEPLVAIFEAWKVPPTPAIHQFFETALRDVIHKRITTRPVQLTGWAHEKVVCPVLHDCNPCRSLNTFLENPQQQIWCIQAAQIIRRHVEDQLTDPHYSLKTTREGVPYTLVVTKLGTNYDKTSRIWQHQAQQVAQIIYALRRDYVKALLGEDKYKALVIIEPSQENAGTTSQENGNYAQSNTKRRRIWE